MPRSVVRATRAALALLVVFGLILTAALPAAADREYLWTLDRDGRPLGSPAPYLYHDEIDGLRLETGAFKNPADLFVDQEANLWVVDTGNKLLLDRRGYICVLNGGGDFRGVFLLDQEGEFRGFFGAMSSCARTLAGFCRS